MPQPIETAPTNGTHILTECGIVVATLVVFGELQTRWVLIDRQRGVRLTNRDGDDWVVNPKLWEPLPDWMHECR